MHDDRVGMGAFSDSAYEYLLKLWVAGGRSRAVAPYRKHWEQAMAAMQAVRAPPAPMLLCVKSISRIAWKHTGPALAAGLLCRLTRGCS